MRRNQGLKALAAIIFIGICASVTGCATHYRLQGNHTWSTPSPQQGRDAYSSQNTSGGGGNTSFVR